MPTTDWVNRTPRVRNGVVTNDLIYSTSIKSNEYVFPHILSLYVLEGSTVADVTYGKGEFWRHVPEDMYVHKDGRIKYRS